MTSAMKTQQQENVSGESSSLPIPMDIIMEIFMRLPLKSIAICRCVSKLWSSILRRPDFTELFFTKSSARPKLLFVKKREDEFFFFSSPQPQNLDENSSPLVANCHIKLSFDSSGATNLGRRSVHGLVCLGFFRFSEGKSVAMLVICNPSTGQALPLPQVKTRRDRVRSMFGYDPIDKQFKVLYMAGSRHEREYKENQVLILGTGNPSSWRRIECCIPHYGEPTTAICINGVLYYKSMSSYKDIYLIICFDVRSEKFSFIEVKVTLHSALRRGILMNYNGKLGLILSEDNKGCFRCFVDDRSTSVKLWVLEDVKKQEWSDHIYVLPALWKNIVGGAILCFAGVTRTNEIVLSPGFRFYPYYLFYFNIERNTVIVRVEIQGTDAPHYGMHLIAVDHVEDVKLYDV